MNETGILDAMPAGIVIFTVTDRHVTASAVNSNLVYFANRVCKDHHYKKTDWTADQLKESFNRNIFAFCEKDYEPAVRQMLTASRTEKISSCRFLLRNCNPKDPVWIYSACTSRKNSDGSRDYFVMFQDISEETKYETELKEQHKMLLKLSYYDALTGVQNRNRYDEYLSRCKKEKIPCAGFAFADINGLKSLNDVYGHLAGDRLLTGFTDILLEYFSRETIYRISGDEFILIVPDVTQESFHKIMEEVIRKSQSQGNIASIGYIWDENITDIQKRVKAAEQLMFIEKQKFYETRDDASSRRRPKILNALMDDLKKQRYVMYLQPKSRITETKIIGAEALIRKIDADRSVVPPYEFIPPLEKERLIPKIDFFMLEKVCQTLEQCGRERLAPLRISVNMSRITIAEHDYLDTVEHICSRYRFDHSLLEFEITETSQTMDSRRLQSTVICLREMGFCVSLDDVGTDYSSFPLLILNGINTVKLDRSFIMQMNNPRVHKLLKHIIAMCHDLEMDVIAEGVETHDSRQELARMGCDMYQGYLLSRPVPAGEFLDKIRNRISMENTLK